MNRKMEYFKSIDFQNVAEARVVLHKARKEDYPREIINELYNKIQQYEVMVEIDTNRACFG